jgi:Ca2+-binding EF-hand superfamily protein
MSNPTEKQYLIEVFKALDSNGDGIIQRAELDRVLKESGFTRQEADELFKYVDVDKDGKISLQEFLKGFQMSQ